MKTRAATVSEAVFGPSAAFEVTMWRALAVFRVATLAYAIVLTAHNATDFDHPAAGWVVLAVMATWSAVATFAYSRPHARAWPLLSADLAVTAGALLASRWVVGHEQLSHGYPTLTITWMAAPVLAMAVTRGRTWGALAAVGMGACDLAVRDVFNQATFTGTAIMVIAAVALGHLALLSRQVQERLRMAVELEAATRERERLARGIHDSVLQVLALVQRRAAELGGEAAELGRLAGDQEVALRALVNPGSSPQVAPAGLVDLRTVLSVHASADVALAAPAAAVWLPARAASEVAAAVGSALDNVRRHGGAGARAWILVEDEPTAVTVTVRDDGPGIDPGRLQQAEHEGRLGVAQSICGRIRDLGGSVSITSVPGQGTRVELSVARANLQANAQVNA